MQINGDEFEVLDAKEKMTVPDCWVMKNKIGTAHGEAKFYVGHAKKELFEFFDDFTRTCFVLKSDLKKYLEEVKTEYENPEQQYRNKEKMEHEWKDYSDKLELLQEYMLKFNISYQDHLKGPRAYINSKDEIYKFIRIISLPNITYFSVLKLKNSDDEIVYYWKLFVDYFGEEEHPLAIKEELEEVEGDVTLDAEEKKTIVRARIGQGEYRRNLLEQCPFCPITMVSDDRILIASHIKPWAKCDTKEERLDPKNGFMFTPTFDFLFDRGYISFRNDKSILISPWLSRMTLSKLGISPNKNYPALPSEGREKYLEYHRDKIFNK
ncbi:HNH endonuclease [Candidatus Pacearchaeota archaeon]|nr:HNH endonuclease [Candidatus Pacearchaeota archaeon]